MSDQRDDLSMYRELQGQWSNMQDENSYGHMKMNEPTNGNDEGFQNHQDYCMQNQYVNQELYSPNMLYTTKPSDNLTGNSSPLTSNHNNYNESIFVSQNANYDANSIQHNFARGDMGNGRHHNNNVNGNNQSQYNMVPANSYELFNQDLSHNMNLQQQCYPMMMNYMPQHHQQHPRMEAEAFNQAHLREPLNPQLYQEVIQAAPDNNHSTLDAGAQYAQAFERQPAGKNQLIDNFLGNWNNNPSGTYTPFGHSFLNVQPNLLLQRESPNVSNTASPVIPEQNIFYNTEPEKIKHVEPISRKETEGFIFSDTTGKKRIVAEVKPMRPSYSAVLSQTPKGPNVPESNKKKGYNTKEQVKPNASKPGGIKSDKARNHFAFGEKPLPTDEKSKKSDSGRKTVFQSQVSSGSESGEPNIEFPIKGHKLNGKNRGKSDNVNRKWVSLDDLSNDNDPPIEEKPGYTNCDSEFVFVSQPEDKGNPKKKNIKKHDPTNVKKSEKSDGINLEYNTSDADPFISQETINESDKLKRKNKDKSSNASRKILSEKNKKNSQNRQKKSKGSGYMGKLQNCMDSWIIILKHVLLWFFNLVSDIFQMSAQLSVDL